MKGDKKTIDILNDLLAGELAAIDQYLIHGEMYADMGFLRLAEHSFHESDHERVHARALIRRILFLEGVPNMVKREPLKIGKDVVDMLTVQLEDTEMDHAYFLEKQLRLVDQVGLQNYKQSQIDGAAPAA